MRRSILALMLVAALFTNAARAQTFACQYVHSSGVYFVDGEWKLTRFKKPKPFFLHLKSDGLDEIGVASLLESIKVTCQKTPLAAMFHWCSDQIGGLFLFFSPTDKKGAVSDLRGSALDGDVVTSLFTCEKI